MADSTKKTNLWMKILGAFVITAFIVMFYYAIPRRRKRSGDIPQLVTPQVGQYIVISQRRRAGAVSAGTADVEMGIIDGFDARGLPRYTVMVEEERYVLRLIILHFE